MTTVFNIIQSLRNTSSRKEKESILKQHSSNILLKRVFALAYNQLTNYYMATVNPTTHGTQGLDETGYTLLSQASNRDITGNELIEKVTAYANTLSKDAQDVFKCIIEKDFKCGVTATTLAKIWKDESAFKDFKAMLCDEFEKNADKVKYPVLVQLKYDASRVIVIVKDDKVTYRSRNGKEYLIDDPELNGDFLAMHKELCEWKDYFKGGVVFDGELYSMKDGKIIDRQTSNGIATKLIRGTASKEEQSKIGITLWDCVILKDFEQDCDTTHYTTRLEWLGNAVYTPEEQERLAKDDISVDYQSGRVQVAKEEVAWTEKEVYNIAQRWIDVGEEGAIVKNPLGYYERKRSKNCLKIKEVQEIDLEIIDIVPGNGKYEGKLGALVCKDKSGKLLVNVGSGLTDKDRDELNTRDVIGKIVSVKYNMTVTNKEDDSLSLFLPRFVEVRFDKTEADTIES